MTKKIIIFVSTILLLNQYIIAQAKTFKIVYRHCVQYDTTKALIDTLGWEATLLGNSIESTYFFLKKDSKNQPNTNSSAKTLQQVINEKAPGTNTLQVNVGASTIDDIGNLVYYNKKKDSVYLREKMQKDYVLTYEKTPKIKWTITTDTKKINNYKCVMATTNFRGRNYIAWFTNDIPIVEGPWKFKGLPGLILSIEDDKGQVKIYATDVKFPVNETIPVFVASGKSITEKEYIEYRDNDFIRTLKGFEQTVSSQENFDKTNLSPKIKKTTALFGIEKKLD